MAEDKMAVALEVARRVKAASEELAAAASRIPDCDCAVLDAEKMAEVVADLMRAEAAARQVHANLRQLEAKHVGVTQALATLETQPLDGLEATPSLPNTPANLSVNMLVEQAANEATGGQCC